MSRATKGDVGLASETRPEGGSVKRQKADPALSTHRAMVMVFNASPELYDAYEEEGVQARGTPTRTPEPECTSLDAAVLALRAAAPHCRRGERQSSRLPATLNCTTPTREERHADHR